MTGFSDGGFKEHLREYILVEYISVARGCFRTSKDITDKDSEEERSNANGSEGSYCSKGTHNVHTSLKKSLLNESKRKPTMRMFLKFFSSERRKLEDNDEEFSFEEWEEDKSIDSGSEDYFLLPISI